MVDLAITPGSVLAGGNANVEHGIAGEAVDAGQALYKEAATGKWRLADSNSPTEEVREAAGIALNGAALDQPVTVQKAGDITIGATLVPGSAYYLSETPGGIQPSADLATGEEVVLLGLAKSTSVLALRIQAPGVTLA